MTKQTNETHAVHLKRSINEKKVQITVEFSRMCWLATENIPKIRQKRNFNLVKKRAKNRIFRKLFITPKPDQTGILCNKIQLSSLRRFPKILVSKYNV